MSVDSVKRKSVLALDGLLVDVIKAPGKWIHNEELISSLKVQGKLAKWSSNELGIKSCSLNTLKTTADLVLNDGFLGLNKKRSSASLAIENELNKTKKPKNGTKLQLGGKVKEQASKISLLEQRNMLLTYIVKELQSLSINYANKSKSESSLEKFERELEYIHKKLSYIGESDLIHKGLKSVE